MSNIIGYNIPSSQEQEPAMGGTTMPVPPMKCHHGPNSSSTSTPASSILSSEVDNIDEKNEQFSKSIRKTKSTSSPWRPNGHPQRLTWRNIRASIASTLVDLVNIAKRSDKRDQAAVSEKPNDSSDAGELPFTASSTSTANEKDAAGPRRHYDWLRSQAVLDTWNRLIESYRKNYCPRTAPALIFPTPPTDTEKHSYVNMQRPFILICGTLALVAVAFGGWMFAKSSPIYSWFAVYILLSESFLFTALFITLFGKRFDYVAHRKILDKAPLIESSAPNVDIYLPVCNEPLELIENTWKYVKSLQYPGTKKQIYVLDDGADEAIRSLAHRFHFEYIRRPDRPALKKAGNIRYAFSQTDGEYFVVLDADFCPRPDFLLETIPYLASNPRCGLLQTSQFFRSLPSQTWTEQGAGAVLEYNYRIMQPCRDRWNGSMCVGTNVIFRREALKPINGASPADESEDVHTGFWVLANGWTLKFLPLNLACGTCPDTPQKLFSQQMRWCTGGVELCISKTFWKRNPNISIAQRLCYLTSFLSFTGQAVQPFLSQLPAPLVLWTKPALFKYYNLFFAFPSIFLELIALRLWTRGRYTLSVQHAHTVMAFSYFQSILDLLFGRKGVWTPSGAGTKSHNATRYTNMRIVAWIWTLGVNGALISGIAYRILQGLKWYNMVPVLIINVYNLLCMHRFLVFRHPKEVK